MSYKSSDQFKKPFSNRQQKGLTLTELLVASVMIGIVMMGVAAFAISIKQFQGSTNKVAFLTMQGKKTMALMVNDAMQAIGDNEDCGKTNDAGADVDCGWGVRYYSNSTRQSICFRHDRAETPNDYTDDDWICYMHDGSYGINRCNTMIKAEVPFVSGGSEKCTEGYSDVITLAKPDGNNFFQIVEDGDGRLQHIEFNLILKSKYDNSAHPVTNPEITLFSQVSPPGHSR